MKTLKNIVQKIEEYLKRIIQKSKNKPLGTAVVEEILLDHKLNLNSMKYAAHNFF